MTKCFKQNYKTNLEATQVVERINTFKGREGDLCEFVYNCGECKAWRISGMIRTYPIEAGNLEMRYHERSLRGNIIFVKTSRVPQFTRTIKQIVINSNGWVTIVCKWSSDRRQITKELIDFLG